MEPFWDSNVHHSIKYESENSGYPFCPETGPNFAAGTMTFSEDDAEFAGNAKRVKPTRQDPLSHRIIEKRRRDRMNSCLADLSRLIPPQYQRKSRGRIEKTEIIEMAIKHIKNIQNKENENRQCYQMDQYREGYHECLATAVQYLIDVSTHFEDICFKMVNHLKEHFNDVLKGDNCHNYGNFKRRFDSTSSGANLMFSGHHFPNSGGTNGELLSSSRVMHLCGEASSSEAELNYAKDLSCRSSSNNNNNSSVNSSTNNPQQTPVITSTGSSQSSNVDVHLETESSSSTTDHNCAMETAAGEKNGVHSEEAPSNRMSKLSAVKVHTLTDNSCDGIEHNHYKYKNYIQQRFCQDRHDEHIVSNSSNELSDHHNPVIGHHQPASKQIPLPPDRDSNDGFAFNVKNCSDLVKEEKMNGVGGHMRLENGKAKVKPSLNCSRHTVPVPIFALHAHGSFYIPLTVDYEVLLPYLGDVSLLDKNVSPIQSLHPVNIHIYTPTFNQLVKTIKD